MQHSSQHTEEVTCKKIRTFSVEYMIFGKGMKHPQILIAALMIAHICSVTCSGEQEHPRKAANMKATPVVLSARPVKSTSKFEQKLQIQLAIGAGYEIYSERKHEFVLPLKLEVLGSRMQPITSTVQYPEPVTVPVDKALGGDYYVYRGNVKLVATYSIDAQPAYVRVFYHGTYKQHS